MNRLTNCRGVTLIEQLAALAIGAVMLVGLFGFSRSELLHVRALETKVANLEDVRGAMDIMARDLKNAGFWAKGLAPAETGSGDDPQNDADATCNRVYGATGQVIHVQMDINGNANCADLDPRENLRYELTGPSGTCPGKTIIRRNGDCLIANVTVPNGKLFRYFDDTGTELSEPLPLDSIKLVRIEFSVRVKNPDARIGGDLVSTLATHVELRN